MCRIGITVSGRGRTATNHGVSHRLPMDTVGRVNRVTPNMETLLRVMEAAVGIILGIMGLLRQRVGALRCRQSTNRLSTKLEGNIARAPSGAIAVTMDGNERVSVVDSCLMLYLHGMWVHFEGGDGPPEFQRMQSFYGLHICEPFRISLSLCVLFYIL